MEKSNKAIPIKKKEKRFVFRQTNEDKVDLRKKEGWRRGCSKEEKEKYGHKRYIGGNSVLMKKEVP